MLQGLSTWTVFHNHRLVIGKRIPTKRGCWFPSFLPFLSPPTLLPSFLYLKPKTGSLENLPCSFNLTNMHSVVKTFCCFSWGAKQQGLLHVAIIFLWVVMYIELKKIWNQIKKTFLSWVNKVTRRRLESCTHYVLIHITFPMEVVNI